MPILGNSSVHSVHSVHSVRSVHSVHSAHRNRLSHTNHIPPLTYPALRYSHRRPERCCSRFRLPRQLARKVLGQQLIGTRNHAEKGPAAMKSLNAIHIPPRAAQMPIISCATLVALIAVGSVCNAASAASAHLPPDGQQPILAVESFPAYPSGLGHNQGEYSSAISDFLFGDIVNHSQSSKPFSPLALGQSQDPCSRIPPGILQRMCRAMYPQPNPSQPNDCGNGSGGSGCNPGGGSGNTTLPTCSLAKTGGTGKEPGGLIPVCCTPTASEKTNVNEVFSQLNQYRISKGLRALAYDTKLETAIQGHSIHENLHSFFDHNAPESVVSSPSARASLCGTSYAGENIAKGATSPTAVMNLWKNSSGHNSNMLNSSFTRVGIGYHNGYWGQLFGR